MCRIELLECVYVVECNMRDKMLEYVCLYSRSLCVCVLCMFTVTPQCIYEVQMVAYWNVAACCLKPTSFIKKRRSKVETAEGGSPQGILLLFFQSTI